MEMQFNLYRTSKTSVVVGKIITVIIFTAIMILKKQFVEKCNNRKGGKLDQ